MAPNFCRTGGDGERERGRIEWRTVRTGGFKGKLTDSRRVFEAILVEEKASDLFFGSWRREIDIFFFSNGREGRSFDEH
jgi:hypothetical protein